MVSNAFSHQIFFAVVYYAFGPPYPYFADGKTDTCKDEERDRGLVVTDRAGTWPEPGCDRQSAASQQLPPWGLNLR